MNGLPFISLSPRRPLSLGKYRNGSSYARSLLTSYNCLFRFFLARASIAAKNQRTENSFQSQRSTPCNSCLIRSFSKDGYPNLQKSVHVKEADRATQKPVYSLKYRKKTTKVPFEEVNLPHWGGFR